MQQGLRMCKHEEVMWVEYLRLELMYIQRLRERRVVLGLDVPDEGAAGERSSARDAGSAEGDMDIEAAPNASVTPDSDDGSDAAARAVLMGAVAGIVLKNALLTFPASLDLRRQLLRVLTGFDFPGIKVRSSEHIFTSQPEL
jgi:U3 small nucleolar RNA-associated protein 6